MDKDVSYAVFETTQARADRREKRLVIALVITILLLFTSNALWLKAWTAYDYADTETDTEMVTVDGGEDGAAGYARDGGTVNNGTSDSETDTDTDANED